MRVHIGPYTNWIGPYQIAEKILFWKDKSSDAVDRLGNFLAYWKWETDYDEGEKDKSFIYRFCDLIESKKKRKIKVKLDRWDTWNMDSTLAIIILPMLKQLKKTKHGSGIVDLEDVPENMRFTEHPDWDENYQFDFYHEDENDQHRHTCDVHTRYEWVLNELIWTFEQLQPDCDWEAQYWKTRPEIDLKKYPEDEGKTVVPVRWKVKGDCDFAALKAHADRIQNGLQLFGKYFKTLWD